MRFTFTLGELVLALMGFLGIVMYLHGLLIGDADMKTTEFKFYLVFFVVCFIGICLKAHCKYTELRNRKENLETENNRLTKQVYKNKI